MSSKYVRDQFDAFVTANLPTETLCDMTAQFGELSEFLASFSVGRNDPWLGVQYIGNEEEPITIPSTNGTGKFREAGIIYLHVVGVAALGAGNAILTRCEAIRSAIRGRRLGDVRIQNVSPPNFNAGATLQFEGGWTSASIIIDYEYDIDL
jgi:hypothetical protein